ncbi:MAG: hypothetical protein K2W96_25200 [Gemmataceae bacterium]|nr:hypothetical protein [Gemmataceae bacterium]
MKRIIPGLAGLLLAASVGCLPFKVDEGQKPPPSQFRSAAPAPPVTADSVTEKNANDKAQELRAELEREAAREPGAR